jgi:hypothetical protein
VMRRKAFVGLSPSFSSHVRFGERGAPVDFLRCLLSNKLRTGHASNFSYDSRAKTSLGARKNGGTIAGMFESGNTSSGSSIPNTSVMNFRLF